MRLPSVPGPHDVVRLVERGTEAVTALLEAAPRLGALLDEAEDLLQRASTALDRLEATGSSADEVLRRTDAIVTRAEQAVMRVDEVVNDAQRSIARVDGVVGKAEQTVGRVDGVIGKAEDTVARSGTVIDDADRAITTTDGLMRRVLTLLDLTEPALTKLQPTLERLADTTHPDEVDALVALVDHLPLLADRMEGEVIPIVRSLQNVGPDIHDLLDLTRALNEMLAAVPGLGRVKKRIDEEQEERAENGDG
ncbi:MAG TPA: hypothetical protein VFR87_02295 [Nocardioidaceae bacterium]|nr:hypothetical protein [Nocardioidaceae bacterium]